MGNENDKSKKIRVLTILGILFMIGNVIWFTLTGFDNNKNRVIFIVLVILLLGIISLGVFLDQKMQKRQ